MNKLNSYNRVIGLQLGLNKSANLEYPKKALEFLTKNLSQIKSKGMDAVNSMKNNPAAMHGLIGAGVGGTAGGGKGLFDVLTDSNLEDSDLKKKLVHILQNAGIGAGAGAGLGALNGAMLHKTKPLLEAAGLKGQEAMEALAEALDKAKGALLRSTGHAKDKVFNAAENVVDDLAAKTPFPTKDLGPTSMWGAPLDPEKGVAGLVKKRPSFTPKTASAFARLLNSAL